MMKYAIDIPHFGDCADPMVLAGLAQAAETAGWDGFFIWDHVAMDWPDPVVDVTVALTAIEAPQTAVSPARIEPSVTDLIFRDKTCFPKAWATYSSSLTTLRARPKGAWVICRIR